MIIENINIEGVWSRWTIKTEVSDDGGAWIQSKNQGLINLPQTGWQYSKDGGWHEDNTIEVKRNSV